MALVLGENYSTDWGLIIALISLPPNPIPRFLSLFIYWKFSCVLAKLGSVLAL